MIEIKNFLLNKSIVLFALGLFFLMHFSYFNGAWLSSSLFFTVVLIFYVLILPPKAAFMVVFSFSLLSSGFSLSSGLMVEAILYLVFGLKLIVLNAIKKEPLDIMNCILITILLAINLTHMQLTEIPSVFRIVVRFIMLLVLLSSKEYFFSCAEKRTLMHLSFGAVCIFAIFAFVSGAEKWGAVGYLDKIEGFFRLGEEYRDFGGADSLGYINCLAFPLILEQFLVNQKRSIFLWIELLVLVIIGILAKTSSFFISFFFMMIAFVFFLSKGTLKSKILALIALVLITGSLFFVAQNSIIFQQGLLRISDGSNGDFSHGRFDIYIDLLRIIFDNFVNFFVGVGFDYTQITGILAHNVLLEIFTCWGFCGFMTLFLLCANFLMNNKIILKDNYAMLFVLSFFLACMTIGTITSDKFYIHFAAGLLFLKNYLKDERK